VRKIYSHFLKSGLTCNGIATYLNEKKIPRDGNLRWNCTVVQRILSHPKYIGCVLFNQKSEKLRSKTKRNPRSEWIVARDCFEPLIARHRFDAVQAKLRNRVFLRSDEDLLAELAAYVEKHGRATHQMLRKDGYMATGLAYAGRFGSLTRALDKVRQEPPEGFSLVELRARIKRALHDEFDTILTVNDLRPRRCKSVSLVLGCPPILVEVAQCVKAKNGQLRWRVRYPVAGRPKDLSCVALRMAPCNRLRMDYVFFETLPEARQRIDFSEERIRNSAAVRDNLADIVQLILHR
jgi:hypothetical protein